MRIVSMAMVMLLGGVAQAAPLPAANELLHKLGLDDAAMNAVMQGKLVDLPTRDLSERDLSVGFVFVVKRAPAEIARAIRHYNDLADDSGVVATHALNPATVAADFASLRLVVHGADETRRYASARAGDTLNLSSDEIAAFDKLGAAATQVEIEAQLRKTLAARYEAYRARGLDGIAPYARGKGELRPGEELARITAALPLLPEYAAPFRALLLAYPQNRQPQLEESYHWLIHDEENRPTIALRHRMTLPIGDGLIAADREFYVSQGYNDMQALGALIPVAGGTLVVYGTHVSVDRVSGAAQAMKHRIGRSKMETSLRQIFERTRARAN